MNQAEVISLFAPMASADLFAAPSDVTRAARDAVAELAPYYGVVGTGVVVVDLVGREAFPARAYLTHSVADPARTTPWPGWLHTAVGALLFVSVEAVEAGRPDRESYAGELYIVPMSRLRRCAAIWAEIADADLGASLRSPRWAVRTANEGKWSTALTVPLEVLASLATWQGSIAFSVSE